MNAGRALHALFHKVQLLPGSQQTPSLSSLGTQALHFLWRFAHETHHPQSMDSEPSGPRSSLSNKLVMVQVEVKEDEAASPTK